MANIETKVFTVAVAGNTVETIKGACDNHAVGDFALTSAVRVNDQVILIFQKVT